MSDDPKKPKVDEKPKEPKAPEAPSAPPVPAEPTEIEVSSRSKRGAHVRRWRFTQEPTRILVADLDADDKASLLGPSPNPSVIVRKV